MRETKKILLVDDNIDIITTFRIALRRLGYSVIVAKDGDECLIKARNEKPDLILLDVRLPRMSGGEVLKRLKESPETKTVPVVAITASMSKETKEMMEEFGADDFLLKPIDVLDLNRVLRRYLGA